MNIRRDLQLWSTRQTRGSNMKLISIGFGNSVNADRIVAVVSPEAAPVKRIVQTLAGKTAKPGADEEPED